MNKKDYYTILGIAKNATEDEIKKSYRKLAMKFHPDRNQEPGAEDSFKEAKEAYEVLSDPAKRATYDQHGHTDPSFGHRPGATRTWNFDPGDMSEFSAIFGDIFKNHTGFHNPQGFNNPQQAARPSHIFVITIQLRDAYLGRTIMDGPTSVTIPKGIRNGTKLYVGAKVYRVDVLPDAKFKRSNDDLLADVEISAIEAMLGVAAVLEHIDGVTLQFSIPAGIQNGQIIKLSGKGISNPETDKHGDMMVRISITIPRNLTDEQKAALKLLQQRDLIHI